MFGAHTPQDFQRGQELVVGLGALEAQRLQDVGHDARTWGKRSRKMAKRTCALVRSRPPALFHQGAELLFGEASEDLLPHGLGRDGGVEQDLGHRPQGPDALLEGLGVAGSLLDQLGPAGGEQPGHQRVELCTMASGDLLDPHGKEGGYQHMALVRRVAGPMLVAPPTPTGGDGSW